MTCGCNNAMGAYHTPPAAVAGYDAATKKYTMPFPGGWFWRLSWPAGNTKTVVSGNYTLPAMIASSPKVEAEWESQCRAGRFPGGMPWNCATAQQRPSAAGYVAIGGAALAVGALAYVLLT